MEEISDDYLFVQNGSVLTGSTYPASASITRELMTIAGGKSHLIKQENLPAEKMVFPLQITGIITNFAILSTLFHT